MDEIGKETYYGILPILSGERLYGFRDAVLVTAGYGIATWCFVQGAFISSVLPFYMAIIATMAGIMLFAVPAFLITVVPARYGCDIWIYQRVIYGYRLNFIFLLFAVAFGSGWDAVNARVFADSIILVANTLGAGIGSEWTPWIGAVCVLSGFVIAWFGPVAVKKTSFIIIPILLLVATFMVVMIFIRITPAELNAVTPVSATDYSSMEEGLMYVMESNFAYCIAWFSCLGILPRLMKSERSNVWGHLIGMGFVMALFICVGVLSGTFMGSLGVYSEDPTEALILIGGPYAGGICLIAIACANISTQALELYAFSLATKVLKPEWTYRKILIGWVVLVLIMTFSGKIWDYYSAFVSIGGCIYAPAIAIFLCDFFLVRKQKFSLRSAYMLEHEYNFSKGFNLVTIAAFGIGVAVYFLLFDPVAYVARSPLFFYLTATGASFIASGVAYLILTKIPVFRRYLKLDITC